jgi:hypothetical protein
MKHETTARYPAPPEVVMRMFTDRAFHIKKLEQMGLSSYEVLDHAFDGRHFRIRVARVVPIAVPGVLKKVVPAESKVINDEHWDVKTLTGKVLVEPKGMPLEIGCISSMSPDGDGCRVCFDWTLKARVPLISGALEKFIVGDVDRRANDEYQLALKLLDAYR